MSKNRIPASRSPAVAACCRWRPWRSPAPARADWLVTRDGARLETKGAWKVDGRRVLFTLPNGTLSTVRTDEVDLDQSALVTTQAQGGPGDAGSRSLKEKKEPVLRLTEKDIPPVSAARNGGRGNRGRWRRPANRGPPRRRGEKTKPRRSRCISWEKTENATGDGLEIFGTIKNGSANIITTPTLLVAIYDADGGLLVDQQWRCQFAADSARQDGELPGAFPGVPDFASVKFDAQGRGSNRRSRTRSRRDVRSEEYEEPSRCRRRRGRPTPNRRR